MEIQIFFGTESGNAEMVAFDLAEELGVDAEDLSDVDVASLDARTLYLIVCSTHGEGELPQSAVPFVDALRESAPSLQGVRYGLFGLGDSTYPNYSAGSDRLGEQLTSLGAERVGEIGRHDAAGRGDASKLASEWATACIQPFMSIAA